MESHNASADPETRYSDGIQRHYTDMPLIDLVSEPPYGHRDMALEGYFAAELAARNRPANDNRRTYRSVRSHQSRHCYNSTSWRYVDVALARVSILDGALARAERRAA